MEMREEEGQICEEFEYAFDALLLIFFQWQYGEEHKGTTGRKGEKGVRLS